MSRKLCVFLNVLQWKSRHSESLKSFLRSEVAKTENFPYEWAEFNRSMVIFSSTGRCPWSAVFENPQGSVLCSVRRKWPPLRVHVTAKLINVERRVALELSCPIVNVISCPLADSSAFDAGFIDDGFIKMLV